MKAILKSIAILAISVSISHADEYTGREKSETCLGCHISYLQGSKIRGPTC